MLLDAHYVVFFSLKYGVKFGLVSTKKQLKQSEVICRLVSGGCGKPLF